jgi:hypothetical protein
MKFVREVPKSINPPRSTKISREVEELKQHPGVWALMKENTYAQNATVYKKHGCLTTTRRNAEGKYDVYACWPRPVQLDPPRKPRSRKTV